MSRLIDVNDIDFVILEDSLHRIEHRKGDEIDCIIGAPEVKAIPLEMLEQIRAEMQELIDWHDCPIEYDNGNDYWYCQAVTQCIGKLDKVIKEVSE